MTAAAIPVFALFAGRLAVAVAILAALSLAGFALVPRRLLPGRARVALPLTLSAGVAAVGSVVWLAGAVVGTWTVLPAFLAIPLASLRRGREWVRLVRRAARQAAALARSQRLLAAAVGTTLALAIPHLLLPLIDTDGLRYHVALPRLFLLEGRIFRYPWDLSGSFPQLAESLYLVGLVSAGGETAKILNALFFAGAVAGLVVFLHEGKRSRGPAFLGALLFAATPVGLVGSGAAFVDQGALFHLVSALLVVSTVRSPAASGFALAAAVATKLTTGPAALALAVAALVKTPRPGRLRCLAWVCVLPALVLAPYAVRNVAATGDPFYPIGYGLLGRPVPGVSHASMPVAVRVYPDAPEPLGIPWAPSMTKERPDETVGWHHALGLFLLPVVLVSRRARLVALVFVVPYLLVCLRIHPATRLLLPLFWGLAVLEARTLALLPGRALAAALGFLAALPALWLAGSILTGLFDPFSFAAGRLTREEFLSKRLPGYRAARLLSAFPPGKVMALDFPGPYYLDRPWIVEGPLHDPPLAIWIAEGADADELLRRLRSLDVRYLLVTPGYGGGTAISLLPLAAERSRVPVAAAFRARLRKVASVDRVDLYEVPPR